MNTFNDIIGQEHIKEHFKSAVCNDTVSHAYIINGAKSSGKMMLANAFTLSLMCERGAGEPCLTCNSCKRVMSGGHPDVIYFVRDKSKKTGIIDVAGIREQVVSSMYSRPLDGRRKVYIIEDADRMNIPAQNALLKTLEEPPSYACMLLLTQSCERLLPTVLSRCIVLNMRPVNDKIIKRYLLENTHALDSQADIAVKMSGGNVGRARLLAEGSEFSRFNEDIVSILKRLPYSDVGIILKFVDTIISYTKRKDKDGQNEAIAFSPDDVFELLVLWYRDVLLCKASDELPDLTFANESDEIAHQAALFTYEAVNEVIKHINEAKSRIMSNVNYETVIELLLIKILEMSKC